MALTERRNRKQKLILPLTVLFLTTPKVLPVGWKATTCETRRAEVSKRMKVIMMEIL
jgi:hypothetical protein